MRKTFLVTPLMAILATGALYSQEIDGTITGRVTGPDNNPLQGVRVAITSPSLLSPRNARTDANGSFRVPILPPGQYSLTYSLDGYISRRSSVTLIAGTTINASAKMQSITAQSATVEITADASGQDFIQIDKTDTSVQTSFTAQRMNEIIGSAITDIATLTPGIDGTFGGNGNAGFNIRGGLGRGNKTLQDGQVVNDALLGTTFNLGLVVEDAIESIAIVTSPLNAKLGNTDGGLISITTKKGTNAFSGSLRVSPSRNGNLWSAQPATYANRNGYRANANNPNDDNMTRSWLFTLRGPIVPGYLTFSYSGTINPSTLNVGTFNSGGVAFANEWQNANIADYQRRVGTFFQTSDGYIIRKAEWYSLDNKDAQYISGTESKSNQFNLYLQVNPDHQLSYYYAQTNSFQVTNGSFQMLEASDEFGLNQIARNWNMIYKGIFGASGILTASYGRSSAFRDQPKAGRDSVQNVFWATYFPKDGIFANENVNNYLGSGIIDLVWARSEPTRSQDVQSAYGNSLGLDSQGSDGSTSTTLNLEYNHILEFKGTHMIDAGVKRVEATAPAIPTGAMRLASPVGRISNTLLNSDVRHPNGSIGNAAAYRGKYIVFNVLNSTINDLEPQAVGRPNYQGNYLNGDELVWLPNATTGIGSLNPNLPIDAGRYLPWLQEMFPSSEDATGAVYSNTTSYFINDMWTINNNHSVMLGLRADQYDVGGEFNTVFKYIKFSPRFEYKFDPFGDQKHLFAISYAHLHQMPNLGLYWPFIDTKYGGTSQKLWSKGAPGYQLVDEADILNPSNYEVNMRQSTINGKLDNRIEDGFQPPTSREYSIWYRRAFTNGGTWKISFVMRDWYNLYDFFPDEVYSYGGVNRMRMVLKNTDEFRRTYSGLEVQWDTPITRKISFGGNYTYGRLLANQSSAGATTTAPGSPTSSQTLQMPAYFDRMYQQLLDRPEGYGIGGYTWGSGRDMWAPTVKTNNEFNLTWYLAFNFTQGKVRSTLTLNGTYAGAAFVYDSIATRVGYDVIQGINSNNGATPSLGGFTMAYGHTIRVNEYTAANTMTTGNLRYTLEMPIVRKLSWTVQGTIGNVFNHRPKSYTAPGVGTSSQTSQLSLSGNVSYPATTHTPFPLTGASATNNPTNYDTFVHRYGYVLDGNVQSYYTGRSSSLSYRTISLSTGLRF